MKRFCNISQKESLFLHEAERSKIGNSFQIRFYVSYVANFSDTWYKDNRCCPNGLVLGLGRAIGRWYQSSEKNWTQWCIKAMNKYVVLLHIHCFLGEEDWLFRSSNTCYMRLIFMKKNHDTNKLFISNIGDVQNVITFRKS